MKVSGNVSYFTSLLINTGNATERINVNNNTDCSENIFIVIKKYVSAMFVADIGTGKR
ncbi:MAG: hypothetical protein R2942_11835 [Ignavibacteria bacterium]